MWERGWRESLWSQMDRHWDLIVIGGGITGAGILRDAARAGLSVLLVEAGDFASGTSSRSTKLVHGGLRYLKTGDIRMTYESVRERDSLLAEGRGLISQVGFLLLNFAEDRTPIWLNELGLTFYDLLALRWTHRYYDARRLRQASPLLNERGLIGGHRYLEAQTDDARLVLRVIREAVRDGGAALNYARVETLLRSADGQVQGIVLCDQVTGRTAEIKAGVVINATGAWADDLRAKIDRPPRLRKLRGSHLILPARRLPLENGFSFMHPTDGRPVSVLPWEGVTLFGTTDADHDAALETEPAISAAEVEYLLTGLRYAFPGLGLGLQDVQATTAGVRAVVDTGQADPSKESREHVLWDEAGLLTVSGGKLTTFRLMARSALRAVSGRLPRRQPGHPRFDSELPMLEEPPEIDFSGALDPALCLRLLGRYGADAPPLIAAALPTELEPIGDSLTVWAEIRWAARAEGVVHLDDLLLRRTRSGLLLPNGGLDHLDRIRAIAQPELGWAEERWAKEAANYARLWKQSYSLPG